MKTTILICLLLSSEVWGQNLAKATIHVRPGDTTYWMTTATGDSFRVNTHIDYRPCDTCPSVAVTKDYGARKQKKEKTGISGVRFFAPKRVLELQSGARPPLDDTTIAYITADTEYYWRDNRWIANAFNDRRIIEVGKSFTISDIDRYLSECYADSEYEVGELGRGTDGGVFWRRFKTQADLIRAETIHPETYAFTPPKVIHRVPTFDDFKKWLRKR